MLCVSQFSSMLSAVTWRCVCVASVAPIDVSNESLNEYKKNRSYWTRCPFKKLRSSESRETQHKPAVQGHITEELNLFGKPVLTLHTDYRTYGEEQSRRSYNTQQQASAWNTEFNVSGPGSVVYIATGYGLDGPGIESRWGARFSAPVQTGPGAHPASCTMGTGSFLWVDAAGTWGWPPTPI